MYSNLKALLNFILTVIIAACYSLQALFLLITGFAKKIILALRYK